MFKSSSDVLFQNVKNHQKSVKDGILVIIFFECNYDRNVAISITDRIMDVSRNLFIIVINFVFTE